MHKWAKQIMDCVKTKVEGKGIDNIDLNELTELELWTRVSSNIAKFDYHYKIIDAMEEAEYGEDYDYQGRKGYNSHRSMSTGRFIKGYEEPVATAIPRMYDERMNMDRMNEYRDGKMHYTVPGPVNGKVESEYDRTRRMYQDSKVSNPTDKNDHVNKLGQNIDVFANDIKMHKHDMSTEEKQAARQKLMNLANEIAN